MLFLKIILIVTFFAILVQDYKERLVYWFLYPIIGIGGFLLFLEQTSLSLVLINVSINLVFIGFNILVCYLYAKYKLKKNLLKDVFGLGDGLFFVFISFSFASFYFVVLFVFSLLLALTIHVFLNYKRQETTVPLAGYMSLFFGVVYLTGLFYNTNFLYAL